jgi:hypothetical protein
VFLFFETDDFQRDYEVMLAKGVEFVRPPREEAYGTVAVFEDLYGNKIDLIERSRKSCGRDSRTSKLLHEEGHDVVDVADGEAEAAHDEDRGEVAPAAAEGEF